MVSGGNFVAELFAVEEDNSVVEKDNFVVEKDKIVEVGSSLVVSGHNFAVEKGMVEGLKRNFAEEVQDQSNCFVVVVAVGSAV